MHRFFWELRFIIEENKFLTSVERHAFVNRAIKNYRKEKDFNNYFNRNIIDKMTIEKGRYWDFLWLIWNLIHLFFKLFNNLHNHFLTLFKN